MAERDIRVTPNFVSQVKTRMRSDGGKTTKKTTKKAAKKKAARTTAATKAATKPAESAATKPAESAATPARDKLSAEDLFEAKKLADELGGIEQARKALDMLERLR